MLPLVVWTILVLFHCNSHVALVNADGSWLFPLQVFPPAAPTDLDVDPPVVTELFAVKVHPDQGYIVAGGWTNGNVDQTQQNSIAQGLIFLVDANGTDSSSVLHQITRYGTNETKVHDVVWSSPCNASGCTYLYSVTVFHPDGTISGELCEEFYDLTAPSTSLSQCSRLDHDIDALAATDELIIATGSTAAGCCGPLVEGVNTTSPSIGNDASFSIIFNIGSRLTTHFTGIFGTNDVDAVRAVAIDTSPDARTSPRTNNCRFAIGGFTRGVFTDQERSMNGSLCTSCDEVDRGDKDGFIQMRDCNGTSIWTVQFGTEQDRSLPRGGLSQTLGKNDRITAITIDHTSGAVYAAGPISRDTSTNILLYKLSENSTVEWQIELGSVNYHDSLTGIAFDHANNFVTLIGFTSGSVGELTNTTMDFESSNCNSPDCALLVKESFLIQVDNSSEVIRAKQSTSRDFMQNDFDVDPLSAAIVEVGTFIREAGAKFSFVRKTAFESFSPTISPTYPQTNTPTNTPTRTPTISPSHSPTQGLTSAPSTSIPISSPTTQPSVSPTIVPTTNTPTRTPTISPSHSPTQDLTSAPSTSIPISSPTTQPSVSPTIVPTRWRSQAPSLPLLIPIDPSYIPTTSPSIQIFFGHTNLSQDSTNMLWIIIVVVAICVIAIFITIAYIWKRSTHRPSPKPDGYRHGTLSEKSAAMIANPIFTGTKSAGSGATVCGNESVVQSISSKAYDSEKEKQEEPQLQYEQIRSSKYLQAENAQPEYLQPSSSSDIYSEPLEPPLTTVHISPPVYYSEPAELMHTPECTQANHSVGQYRRFVDISDLNDTRPSSTLLAANYAQPVGYAQPHQNAGQYSRFLDVTHADNTQVSDSADTESVDYAQPVELNEGDELYSLPTMGAPTIYSDLTDTT